MAKKIFVAEMALWISNLSELLHQGNAWRLAPGCDRNPAGVFGVLGKLG